MDILRRVFTLSETGKHRYDNLHGIPNSKNWFRLMDVLKKGKVNTQLTDNTGNIVRVNCDLATVMADGMGSWQEPVIIVSVWQPISDTDIAIFSRMHRQWGAGEALISAQTYAVSTLTGNRIGDMSFDYIVNPRNQYLVQVDHGFLDSGDDGWGLPTGKYTPPPRLMPNILTRAFLITYNLFDRKGEPFDIPSLSLNNTPQIL